VSLGYVIMTDGFGLLTVVGSRSFWFLLMVGSGLADGNSTRYSFQGFQIDRRFHFGFLFMI
jgi:hypothetical protein